MFAKSDGKRSSRARVYNEPPNSDSSSSFSNAPGPTGQIALPRSRWDLSFLDDELEFKFRQWFDASFRSTLVTPRVTATMGTTLAVLAIIIFLSLLFSLQRLESPEGMLPTPVMLAELLVFSSYCFGASFHQAQSSVWAKVAGLIFPVIVIMTGVIVYYATSLSREVLQTEAHASEDMISTSVDKLVLDIAAFLSLSIGGHAIQILCLRTLESEYTTLRLSVSILLCSALGVSTTLETYDLASILPHLVILFLGNVLLIVCVHVIKRRAEKQLRREFIALCKEPLLATAAAGENRELQRRNSDVLSISGKVNDESVLCEVTARALRKLPQDRLKLLSCRNADVLLLGSIGQGNFGQVYRARYRGSMVAVKTFTFAKVGDMELEHFWHEAAISQRLQHPNILSFFGASISVPEKTAYCIIELGEGGTFDDVLSNPEYTWVNGRRNIMQGLSRAMCYLHSFLADIIVHHDLKPSNILISKTFEAKLSDFGVSISRPRHPGTAPESAQEQSHKEVESLDGPRANSLEINKTSKKQSTARGSPVYLAPEVHRGEAFSEKIDVYAFGLILCEALIGDGLYVVKSYNSLKGGLAKALSSGFRPSIPESVRVAAPGLVELMQECWAEDANARPSFQMINQRFETLVEEEIEVLTSAVSSTLQPGTSAIDGSNLFAVHAISELKAGTNAEIENIEGADDESISESSRSGKNLAVITQSPSAESLPSVVLASHQHGREVRVPSVVGLLQRGDTISSAMVPPMQRSPTGRSFSTFAFSAVGAAGQETGVFRELCSELQEELRQQSEMYECKLADQKEKYEKQLASLAEALL